MYCAVDMWRPVQPGNLVRRLSRNKAASGVARGLLDSVAHH